MPINPATVQQLEGDRIEYDTRPTPLETFAKVLASGVQGWSGRQEKEKERTSLEKRAAFPSLIAGKYLQPTAGKGDTTFAGMNLDYQDPTSLVSKVGSKEYWSIKKTIAEIEAIKGRGSVTDAEAFKAAFDQVGDMSGEMHYQRLLKEDMANKIDPMSPESKALQYKNQKIWDAYNNARGMQAQFNALRQPPGQQLPAKEDAPAAAAAGKKIANIDMKKLETDVNLALQKYTPEEVSAKVDADLEAAGIDEGVRQAVLTKFNLPAAKKTSVSARLGGNTKEMSQFIGQVLGSLKPSSSFQTGREADVAPLVKFAEEFMKGYSGE